MSQLLPCPSCARHVRQSESACPFCETALSLEDVPARAMPTQRLGRAATFAFGAAMATSVAACGTANTPGDADNPGDRPDANVAMNDAGTDGGLVAAYGGPPIDAGTDAAFVGMYGGPPPMDAGPAPDAWGAALYGAPPPPPEPEQP